MARITLIAALVGASFACTHPWPEDGAPVQDTPSTPEAPDEIEDFFDLPDDTDPAEGFVLEGLEVALTGRGGDPLFRLHYLGGYGALSLAELAVVLEDPQGPLDALFSPEQEGFAPSELEPGESLLVLEPYEATIDAAHHGIPFTVVVLRDPGEVLWLGQWLP